MDSWAIWPIQLRSALGSWNVSPVTNFRYPPAAVLPTSTSTWDPVYRPTMRPITLSHDESRQVKYDDDQPKKETKKKLGFFKNKDQRRMKGEHGHDAYARDEL